MAISVERDDESGCANETSPEDNDSFVSRLVASMSPIEAEREDVRVPPSIADAGVLRDDIVPRSCSET